MDSEEKQRRQRRLAEGFDPIEKNDALSAQIPIHCEG
jgi:hypothetical protein